jgi:hypothetical protein
MWRKQIIRHLARILAAGFKAIVVPALSGLLHLAVVIRCGVIQSRIDTGSFRSMEKRLKLITIRRAGFTAKGPATIGKIGETMRYDTIYGRLAVLIGFHIHFPLNGNRLGLRIKHILTIHSA